MITKQSAQQVRGHVADLKLRPKDAAIWGTMTVSIGQKAQKQESLSKSFKFSLHFLHFSRGITTFTVAYLKLCPKDAAIWGNMTVSIGLKAHTPDLLVKSFKFSQNCLPFSH